MAIITFVGAFGSLFLKKGAVKMKFNIKSMLRNYYLMGGVVIYVLNSLFFVWLLKFVQLSFLYPLTALGYVWIALLSIRYLHEQMHLLRWIGIFLIIIGIFLITL